MSEFKGTKGKWEASFEAAWGNVVRVKGEKYIAFKLDKDDAKLIAAAPELLRSVKDLLGELSVDINTDPAGYSHIVQRALSAIKKATE